MGYLAERLMQTIFVPAGFPFSSLFSLHRPPESNSMKWDGIPRFREADSAPCACNTNWDAKLRGRTDCPDRKDLFLETPPRPYTEAAADSGQGPVSIGFLWQRGLCGDWPNWDFDYANW
jgi:hypothetical protein